MNNYWKIIIPILVTLTITFGIIEHKNIPHFSFGSNTKISHFTSNDDKSLNDYYKAGQLVSNSANQQTSSTTTFLAVGDINLSRGVATEIQKANNPNLPFLGMENILKSADFNFGNLESPMAPDTLPCHLQPDCLTFSTNKNSKVGVIGGHSLIFATPFSYLAGLGNNNFKVLNLANNHAFDQGLSGIINTKLGLDSLAEITTSNTLSIATMGTGQNLDEAWKPAVVNTNGIKLCFIGASFSSINDGGKVKNDYVARIEDLNRLKSAILNSQSSCDFTVVTMHAGTEYTATANEAQKTFAHAAIDYGADIVIGAHPHWVQNIEKYCPSQTSPPFQGGAGGGYDCKYIFYSLGNFIFDQSWSKETSQGLTLKITLSKQTNAAVSPSFSKEGVGGSSMSSDNLQGSRQSAQLDSIELIPVIIKNSAPVPASEIEAKNILNKIGQLEKILK